MHVLAGEHTDANLIKYFIRNRERKSILFIQINTYSFDRYVQKKLRFNRTNIYLRPRARESFIVQNLRLTQKARIPLRKCDSSIRKRPSAKGESVREDAVVRTLAANKNRWSGILTDLPGPKEETREDLVRGRRAVRHWWHPVYVLVIVTFEITVFQENQ